MANWLKHIFLGCMELSSRTRAVPKVFAVVITCSAGFIAPYALAETPATEAKPAAVQVIKPEVNPREVTEDAIDDEFFEVGAYVGVLSIDNFGSEPVYGVNAAFHATEDFFLQFNYGISKAEKTTFETLSGEDVNLLSDQDRDFTYYNLLLGYNIFPGEVFLTSKLTFNSAFYLVGGVGNTDFGGEDNFTTTLGTGYRIVLRDWLTWHIDYRDYIFKSDIIQKDQTTHNIELSTGVTFFF